MAKFYPSLDEIPYLHEPVTAGEGELLNWLDAHLDDSYDVYFQPRVNGNHMDVVILRKNHGAMIIEVKDWNPDSYWIDSSNQWHVRTERGWHAITEDPIEQVTRYRKALYLLYMNGFQKAFAGDNNMYGMISRCVFFLVLRARGRRRYDGSTTLTSQTYKLWGGNSWKIPRILRMPWTMRT